MRILAAVGVLVVCGLTVSAQTNPDPHRFENDIAAFEAEDRAAPPPAAAALFVGSSSSREGDVAGAFPGL